MRKPAFLIVLIALLLVCDPLFSAPTIGSEVSLPFQQVVPLPEPFSERDEIETKCGICYKVRDSDFCYFNCKPSDDYPKGHIYCNNCIVNTVARYQPCPHCRAKLNDTIINQLFSSDPLATWTFILERLKFEQFDLTKPLNHLVSKRFTTDDLHYMLSYITKLLYAGASIYNQDIEPIISNAIYAIKIIESNIEVYHELDSEKQAYMVEYLKHGHYKVVKEIIMHSNSESEKMEMIEELIQTSFQHKNTTFLYDYMKNTATIDENEQFIEDVIFHARYHGHLYGLLELIHSIFENDIVLVERYSSMIT